MLKARLLGEGSGAVGEIASGVSSRNIWKGALAGLAINIKGGSLLDTIAGSSVPPENNNNYASQTDQKTVTTHHQPPARNYAQLQYQTHPQGNYSEGYQVGYYIGFKEGYLQSMGDALRDAGITN
jgi:hypothetical protein